MSSKSKARLPAEPLISIRIAFLRPVANRVASKTPSAPPVNRAMKTAASSTVTGPRSVPAEPERPACSVATGRSLTNVSSWPDTSVICSPVMYWVRSTMCAPMSPSAPEPAFSLSQPPRQRRLRVGDPVLEVLRPHVPDLADPALGDQLPGQRDRRHPAVGEADHRAYAVRARPARRRRSSPPPRRPCWPAASRTARACRPPAPRSRSRRGCRRACRCRRGRCRRARRGGASRSRSRPSRAARPPRRPGRRRGRRRPASSGSAGGRRSAARCARPGSGRRP